MGKLTAEQKAARNEKIGGVLGTASSVASSASGIIGSAIQNSKINDTTGYEENIESVRNTNFDVGDYDTLMSVYNPLALNNMVSFKQIRGGSTAGRASNVLSATANGAMTGLTFGPWGALAGAATGLATSVGGWIAGDSKAKSKVDELNAENHMASNEYINNFSANAERIGNNMFRSKILNLAACGGLLPRKFAFGGLQPDYSNGVTLVKNGGTHEANPYEGVQVGVDPQGVPNLVEEGEVIYDDYVYSNRLKPTKKQLESISLSSKYFGKTYAEIAKDIQKRSDEIPNDPIERRGLEDGMYKLRAIQDETKQRMEQKRFMREFNKLSNDDKFALINGLNQEARHIQQQRLAEEQNQEEFNQSQPNQEAGIAAQMNQYANAIGNYAHGGNLYPDGGDIKIVIPSELYKVAALRNAYQSYKDGAGVDFTELFNTTNTIKVPKEVLDEFGLNKSFNDYTESDLNKLYELNDFYSYYMPDVNNGYISLDDVRSAYNRYSTGDYSTQGEIDAAAINGGRWYNSDSYNGGLNSTLLPISGTDEYSGGVINPSVFVGHKELPDSSEITNNAINDLYNRINGTSDRLADEFLNKIGKFGPVDVNPEPPVEESVIEDIPKYRVNPINIPSTSTGLISESEQNKILKDAFNKNEDPFDYSFIDLSDILDNKDNNDENKTPVITNTKLKENYPTWLRNMPLLTSSGSVLGDLFGLNKPDYSLWDNAIKAANRINYVSPTPLGNYLTYNPYDVNYMQGRINAQNAMAQRNILNTASGNRGAAISGLLATHQQGLNNMSDMYRQALEYNDKQRQAVADFNRGTDQINAQMSLQAQMQNAQLDRQKVSDLIQLAAQKQNIRNASQDAIAGNLTNLATLAGKYGKENLDLNNLNHLINNDTISIGSSEDSNISTNTTTTADTTKKNGGKLKRRRR